MGMRFLTQFSCGSVCVCEYMCVRVSMRCICMCVCDILYAWSCRCSVCTDPVKLCMDCITNNPWPSSPEKAGCVCTWPSSAAIVSTACRTCMPGFFLVSGACVQCTANCMQCDSATNCLTCAPNFSPQLNGICKGMCLRVSDAFYERLYLTSPHPRECNHVTSRVCPVS
jgi:hypothetical protein